MHDRWQHLQQQIRVISGEDEMAAHAEAATASIKRANSSA
jgi:hypothetical protein